MTRTLAEAFPDAHCELDFTTPLELAVATILSAQSTDVRVNLTTPEQRKRWLPGFCSGELVTAIAMSEPGAGSDLAGIRTTAVRDGDGR